MEVPRPAATVALVRDGDTGIETYLLVRNHLLEFAAGATVFPGGRVDDSDHDPCLFDVTEELTEFELSRAVGSPPGASGYWFAAIRECFEEVGVLLVDDAGSGAPDPDQLHAYRGALLHEETTLIDACRSLGVSLAVSSLRYLAQWITPPQSPRRYETRFFIAPMPDDQEPDPDRGELVSGRWWTPVDALDAHDAGDLELILPTQRSLRVIGAHDTVAELFDAMDAAGSPPPMIDDNGGHRLWLSSVDSDSRGEEP